MVTNARYNFTIVNKRWSISENDIKNVFISSLEDSSVRNMLVKAVCLTNASLAVHSK